MAADPARLVGHNAKKDGAHAFFYAHLSLESHVWYVMTANGAVLRTLPPMPCCMWFLQLDDAVALLPYLRCYYAAMTLSRSFAVGLVQARSGPEQALFCRLSSWCSFLWRLTLQDLLGTMLKRMVRMLSSMHIWAWSHMSGMWWLRMVQFWGPSLPCPAVCGFSNWMMQWPFYHIYAAITLLWPWAGPLLLALCRPVLALSRPFFADLALGAAFYGGWPCKTCWAQC